MNKKRKSVVLSVFIFLCYSILYVEVRAKIQTEDSIQAAEGISSANNEPRGPDDSHCVSGQVWLDMNGNGQTEDNERSVPDVRIKLQDHTGNFLGDRLTDSFGSFTFDNLKPGLYSVEVVQPFGIMFIGDSNGDPTKKWYNVESALCTNPIVAANVPVREDIGTQVDIHVSKVIQNGLPCAKISWTVYNSTDIYGFNISRSLTGKKSDAVLLRENIPMRMGSSEYNYITEDILVQSGIIYDYWLEVVAVDGEVTSYRPAGVACGHTGYFNLWNGLSSSNRIFTDYLSYDGVSF